jgi:hypothetical protein
VFYVYDNINIWTCHKQIKIVVNLVIFVSCFCGITHTLLVVTRFCSWLYDKNTNTGGKATNSNTGVNVQSCDKVLFTD